MSCEVSLPRAVSGASATFVREGTDGTRSAIIQEALALEPYAAEDLFAGLRHSCSKLTSDAENPGRYEPIDLPPFADDSVAYGDLTFSGDGDSSPRDDAGAVYIRRGDILVLVSLVSGHDLKLADVASMVASKLDGVGALPEPTPSVGEGCTPDPTPSAGDAGLADKLLDLNDMPAGWITYHPPPCGLLSGGTCNDDDTLATPSAIARTSFESTRSVLFEWLERYDGDAASQVMDEFAARLEVSNGCTSTYDTGEVRRSWMAIPAPALGDQTIGWQMIASGSGSSSKTTTYAIRRDHTIAFLTLVFRNGGPIGQTAAGALDPFATRADERLRN